MHMLKFDKKKKPDRTRRVKQAAIIALCVLALFGTNCKKKKGLFLLWPLAFVGMESNNPLDQNGNPLPDPLDGAVQEVPTSGPARIIGSLNATINGAPDLSFDYNRVTVHLINSNDGSVIASVPLQTDGGYVFDLDELENNSYRVLIPDGAGLNYGHRDFIFTYNPAGSGPTLVELAPINSERLFYTHGPALIGGRVVTSGYNGGGVNIPAGPLPEGTTVQLVKDNNMIASARTDENGNYSFDINDLANGNYAIVVLGSRQVLQGRPFSDVSQALRFTFAGQSPSSQTSVSVNPINSPWDFATESPAALGGTARNLANNIIPAGLTAILKDENGDEIARTITGTDGSFAFNRTLATQVLQITLKSAAYQTLTHNLSFSAHPAGARVTLNLGNIDLTPRDSEVTLNVNGATGITVAYRPAADYDKLSYLSATPAYSAVVATWLAEIAGGAYETFQPQSYSEPGGEGLYAFTAPAGKWEYVISAPGYLSSSPQVLTLNGQNANLAAALTPHPARSRLGGRTIILDRPVSGAKHAYPSAAGYTAKGYALPGLQVVMLGNQNNSGQDVAHIATTDAAGNFSLSAAHIVLTNNLSDDAQKVAYALAHFAEASSEDIAGDNPLNNSILSVGGNSYFKSGAYSLYVSDPRGHIITGTAILNNSSVAVNNPGPGTLLSRDLQLSHLNRKRLSGVVSDAVSTAPLSGAQVSLGRDSNPDPAVVEFAPVRQDNVPIHNISRAEPAADIEVAPRITGSDGAFAFEDIDPGIYILRVVKDGYVPVTIPVVVPSEGEVEPVNPGLVLDGPRGNLTGHIKTPGGHNFTGAYTLEVLHPTSGARPPQGVQPASLQSGPTQFENAPNYSVFALTPGQWKVRFVSSGYMTVEGLVTIQPGLTTRFDIITFVPGSHPAATVRGTTRNAITNKNIQGLTARLRPGVGITSGPYATDENDAEIGAVSTGADGVFAIPGVPPGDYTLEISGHDNNGNDFATTYRTVISAGPDTPAASQVIVLVSPVLGSDEVRVVLSWNAEPRDLDSHLEYGARAPYQVVWNDRNKLSDDLTLDVDVVTGFGPETVTLKGSAWNQARLGYSVFNYSHGYYYPGTTYWSPFTIDQSGARVQIFKSQGLVKEYFAGPVDDWWQVFCLTQHKTLVDVGQPGCEKSSFFNRHTN